MKNNKKIPINRINKFFSEGDFGLEVDFGREWLEGDINIKVILFQVERGESLNDDIYGETGRDEIRFKPPVEISVNFQMEAPSNKAYNSDGSLRYLEHGNLTLGVYQDHLDELGVEVNYGDYIGYAETEDKLKYYTVSNNGIIHSDNAHTIGGYKGFYRTITCVTTDLDEFKGV
jgi:hypothetical protein|tara:strand:+ start:4139 stop:4660 length:522 start_codon:yes stop_codon:yes gene_type:complete